MIQNIYNEAKPELLKRSNVNNVPTIKERL